MLEEFRAQGTVILDQRIVKSFCSEHDEVSRPDELACPGGNDINSNARVETIVHDRRADLAAQRTGTQPENKIASADKDYLAAAGARGCGAHALLDANGPVIRFPRHHDREAQE